MADQDYAHKKPRKSNFSSSEVDALITTVKKHYGVLYGPNHKRGANKLARHRCWVDILRHVNQVSVEKRTLQEVKNKWKKCQYYYKSKDREYFAQFGNRNHDSARSYLKTMKPIPIVEEKVRIRRCGAYDLNFKREVIEYAEEMKSNRAARKRYGISESNIRRWRRTKDDIFHKADKKRNGRPGRRASQIFIDEFDDDSSLDSMPLEQRMAGPAESGGQGSLKSQPISPTKLKVTRQHSKSQSAAQRQPKAPEPEEVCLRWNSHHSNMQSAFPSLLRREQYVDVTLVAEGKTIKCHRLILSSCSPYFEEVLSGISPNQHPIFFMKDVPYWILKSLCDFMYAGEVHIFQNKLQDLLAVAEALRIKGLAGKCADSSPQPQFKDVRSNNYASTSRRDVEDEVDPLDLLEPVYEEISKPSTSAGKPGKEAKIVPVKKVIPRKIKKRKLSEESEDANLFQSPALVFPPRKGTRSRPNVKIPKYYHSIYDTTAPSGRTAPIEREPHRTFDPLIGVDDIKAEPFDPDDELIEIENNVVFADQEEAVEEEIVPDKANVSPHPVLLEKAGVGGAKMQIINLGKTADGNAKIFDRKEDPLDTGLEIIDTANNKVVDPLILHSGDDDQMIISNIRSVADDLLDKDNSAEEITGNDNEIHLAANDDSADKLDNANSIENVENSDVLPHNEESIDKFTENGEEPRNIEDSIENSIENAEIPASDPIVDNPEESIEISETNLQDLDQNIQSTPENHETESNSDLMDISETNLEHVDANLQEVNENSEVQPNPDNPEESMEIPEAQPDESNVLSVNEELTANHDENAKSDEVIDEDAEISAANEELAHKDNENDPDLDAMTEKALLECTEPSENDHDQDQEADLQNLLQSLDDQ